MDDVPFAPVVLPVLLRGFDDIARREELLFHVPIKARREYRSRQHDLNFLRVVVDRVGMIGHVAPRARRAAAGSDRLQRQPAEKPIDHIHGMHFVSHGLPTRRLLPDLPIANLVQLIRRTRHNLILLRRLALDEIRPRHADLADRPGIEQRLGALIDVGIPPLQPDGSVVSNGDNAEEDLRSIIADAVVVSPDAVLMSITWFGQDGPYRDFAGADGVCQALTSQIAALGKPGEPPLIPSGYQAQIVAGLTAFGAAVGQVMARELGNVEGPGHLDASIFEANVSFAEIGAVQGYNGKPTRSRLGVNRFRPTYPIGVYPCRDGWLGVTVLTPSQWKSFCTLLDIEHLAGVEKYQETLGRLEDADKLEGLIASRIEGQSAEELFHKGQGMRIPLAIVPTMEQLFRVDQYVEREAFAEVSHPDLGEFQAPVTPFRLYGSQAKAGGPVSRLGADTKEVMAEAEGSQ